MNKLIFGADSTEGIVNITLKDNHVYLYTESTTGEVKLNKIPYTPWVLSPYPVKKYSEKLKGDQYWAYITSTTSEKFENLQKEFVRDLWIPRAVEECYTLCEGATYFKNRKVEDISVLSFDIETSGLSHNDDSIVYIISNTFRKNGKVEKKLFVLDDYLNDYDGEAASCVNMIGEWCKWVRTIDPSIMCGHNILSYDLPYLTYCFEENLHLGRDGSSMIISEKTSRFRKDGSQQYDYHNARITGREIIDTYFLSMKYDIGRDFPTYGLKSIIKHLGLEKEGRSLIDAGKIRKYYDNRENDPEMWAKVKAYATEDSEDSLKLYDKMIPSYFYLAQSIPKTFQQMINEASGSQLDALMIRAYLQDGYSQPRTSNKVPFEGAVSMGCPGIYEYVRKADIASLYPSIMLEYEISDKQKDPNGYMTTMLRYFRDERLKNKKLAKETGVQYYDDMQNAQKIMINSMYGFLGSRFLLYNFPSGAAAVTRYGREILLKGVEWATGHTLEKVIKHVANEGTEDEEISYEFKIGAKVSEGRGYTLVNVDTDSFSITNNEKTTKEAFAAELQELNSLYPALIRWEDDGIYEKVIVIRAKNYVLVKDGKTKYKGSAVTDQKKEPALAEMLEEMIQAMLNGQKDTLTSIYRKYVNEIMNIQDINRWVTKKTVTKSVLNPDRLTEQKIYDAIQDAIRNNVFEDVSEGDKILLYNSINGTIQETKKGVATFYKDGTPKMLPNRILKHYFLYKNDADIEHYLGRVKDTVSILDNLINVNDFPDYSLKRHKTLLKEVV